MSETQTKIKVDTTIQPPPMFKVVYVNDDQTSMEFVIESLINFFDYDQVSAEHITVDIHQNGQAAVAVLPYEIAEQKGIEITVTARQAGYPLQIKLELKIHEHSARRFSN